MLCTSNIISHHSAEFLVLLQRRRFSNKSYWFWVVRYHQTRFIQNYNILLIFFVWNSWWNPTIWPIYTDQKLNEIVGSAYYVAPEVLRRSYGTEADVWSIGVIAYILLCGSRPFWARTESGIFRAVLKASPHFDDDSWPSSSTEAKDFVRCLLCKDPNRRITATQALCEL